MDDHAIAKWVEKRGGCCAPFHGELGPHLTQLCLGRGLPAYQVVCWSIQPFGHSIDMHRSGGCGAHFGGRAGCLSNNVAWTEAYLLTKWILIHPAVWRQQTWSENWGLCPLFEGEAGSPSNTMSPAGLRSTSIPSGMLIHRTIWRQYTNATEKQRKLDRQNRQTAVR